MASYVNLLEEFNFKDNMQIGQTWRLMSISNKFNAVASLHEND